MLFSGSPGFITELDLDNFFFIAKCVLSEKDPALELPDDKQRMATVYGKVRDHSHALRHGIRETLILLAVYGNHLFSKRLGFNAQQHVSRLIERLLLPLDSEKILSHNEDLPNYAEAAPEEFLRLLEDDLRKPEPIVRELMRQVKIGFMVAPRRLGLIRALENLAWNPQSFPRVVDILARLCTLGESEAKDNWGHTPENTLQSLFLSWLPQTAASIDVRIRVLERLYQNYAELGWVICIEQLDRGLNSASPNPRPRWRDDAKSAGYGVSETERRLFIRKAIDLVLAWPLHNEKTLGDLVQCLEGFSSEDQLKIWDLINQWADQAASEDAKASFAPAHSWMRTCAST